LALSWYQRAANANHRLAVARLAHAYEAGELGLAPDRLKALEYRAREARCLQRQQAQAASGS
ncbi:MAG: sel1 repeat family protein, partial [Gammaproteobacteria bacterium]|nr:sel1 repeat family protein [Gammaproteobacteria bacterium]